MKPCFCFGCSSCVYGLKGTCHTSHLTFTSARTSVRFETEQRTSIQNTLRRLMRHSNSRMNQNYGLQRKPNAIGRQTFTNPITHA